MTKTPDKPAEDLARELQTKQAIKALFNAKSDDDLAGAPEAQMVGDFSRATLHRRVNDGSFPAPVYPSPGMARWIVGDLRRWLKKAATRTVRHSSVTGRVQAAVDAAKDRRKANAVGA